jgi:hypothetical protein
VRISGKPTVINGTLTLADTEYEIDLPYNCHKFTLKARVAADVKLAYEAGKSGTAYITVTAGTNYWEDGLRTNFSIYVQSPTAGTVVEVIAWHGGDDLIA